MPFDKLLEERIDAFGGDIRLFVRTFDGREFDHQADKISDPASVIKLCALLEAFETLDLDERIAIPHDPKAGGWGVLRRLSDEVALSMRDVVTLMVIYSDNLASDIVLSRINREAMHERMRSLGLRRTSAWNGFGTSWEPSRDSRENATTPRDIVKLCEHLRARPEIMDVLAKQTDRTLLHHATPGDVSRFTKSGQSGRIRNDAGVLRWEGGGCSIALFAERNRDVKGFRELLEYDMEIVPVAEAAYRWARG